MVAQDVHVQEKFILALDAGTTSCRAILFDRSGQVVKEAQQEITQYFPKSGWVEQDAEEIWNVQLQVAKEATAGLTADQVVSIGITNQRETTVIWDRMTRKPICPAIVWQCRRTSELCEQLNADGHASTIQAKTGLVVDPYFSATKIRWILDQNETWQRKAEQGELLFGTIDTWLIWQLTEGRAHVTDYSNASRTMLFNIYELKWDEELLNLFHIPSEILPTVRESSGILGQTSLLFTGESTTISGVAGDQQAALFGQACFEEGMAKNTYGTGCFMLYHTGKQPIQSSHGLLTTIAWGINGTIEYALEGSVFVAGAVVQWLRDGLEIIESSAEVEALATSVADHGGVYFVPAFTGLGSPYWNPHARGMITGMERGTLKAHIVRAALESIAYQSTDVLRLMESESGHRIKLLRADGGAAENSFLMQFQADLLQTEVARAGSVETTALGAAFLAGLAVGYWKDREEISALWSSSGSFYPQMSEQMRDEYYDGWQRAVAYQL